MHILDRPSSPAFSQWQRAFKVSFDIVICTIITLASEQGKVRLLKRSYDTKGNRC